MIWSHDLVCCHKVASSVVLKPGSSSPGWVHQCPQNLWHFTPHSAWQSCSRPWWEPTLAWAPRAEASVFSQVVEEELQSVPRCPEEQQDTCAVLWGTLRGWLCTRSLWNGKCTPILQLGMPTSPWSKGLHGLLQTELLLDVRGMWFVQQEVYEGHLSSSRLCGFELHLTHTGIPSHKISWILLI